MQIMSNIILITLVFLVILNLLITVGLFYVVLLTSVKDETITEPKKENNKPFHERMKDIKKTRQPATRS